LYWNVSHRRAGLPAVLDQRLDPPTLSSPLVVNYWCRIVDVHRAGGHAKRGRGSYRALCSSLSVSPALGAFKVCPWFENSFVRILNCVVVGYGEPQRGRRGSRAWWGLHALGVMKQNTFTAHRIRGGLVGKIWTFSTPFWLYSAAWFYDRSARRKALAGVATCVTGLAHRRAAGRAPTIQRRPLLSSRSRGCFR